MELLEVKKYPNSVLRKKCEPVKEITTVEAELFNNMLYTMRQSKGIGLACPQIGILRRIIVVDIGDGKAIKLANPAIVSSKGIDRMEEGCLSLPDVNVNVKRPFEAVVIGMNEEGRVVELNLKGLLARVVQHEIDHLDGKLIIDYASVWEKMRIDTKIKGPKL